LRLLGDRNEKQQEIIRCVGKDLANMEVKGKGNSKEEEEKDRRILGRLRNMEEESMGSNEEKEKEVKEVKVSGLSLLVNPFVYKLNNSGS